MGGEPDAGRARDPVALSLLWLVLQACAATGPGVAADPAFAAAACEVGDRVGLVFVDVAEPPYTVRLTGWRTDDRGATWAPVLSEDAAFGSVVARGDHVWVAAHLRRAGVFPMLWRSADAGATWAYVDAPPTDAASPEIEALALGDGWTAARLAGAWRRTDDAGTTWSTDVGLPDDAATACATGDWLRVTPTATGWRVERRVRRAWRAVVDVPRFVVEP